MTEAQQLTGQWMEVGQGLRPAQSEVPWWLKKDFVESLKRSQK
jgi:hypothetical protein